MRVLVVNRSNASISPGGDVVQLEKTIKKLKVLDVEPRHCLVGAIKEDDWDVDIVHIFNIQTVDESWKVMQDAKSRNLPVALSPIFWRPYEGWFSNASQTVFPWNIIRNALGYRFGYFLYRSWQTKKSVRSDQWKIQRNLLTHADIILPNSELELMEIARSFSMKITDAFYRIIPNGIDRDLFQRLDKPTNQLRSMCGSKDCILQVGRISPEKNCLGLINSLMDIDNPIMFIGKTSIGDDEYLAECIKAGEKRGNVYFLEWLPYDELPGYYLAAKVHALPSWRETPGLSSLEAAASGINVVSTSIGSAKEYFGSDAWYCHPGCQRTIREAVAEALEMPLRESLRERILEKFTWDHAAAETLKAYQMVLNI